MQKGGRFGTFSVASLETARTERKMMTHRSGTCKIMINRLIPNAQVDNTEIDDAPVDFEERMDVDDLDGDEDNEQPIRVSLFVTNSPNDTAYLIIKQRKEKTRAREKKRPANNMDVDNRTKKRRVQGMMGDDDDDDYQVDDNDIDEDDDDPMKLSDMEPPRDEQDCITTVTVTRFIFIVHAIDKLT